MNDRGGLDAKTGLQLNPRPVVRRNQYGGTIGGPVILPHFNGRNRLFFFGSAERVSDKNSAGSAQTPADIPMQNRIAFAGGTPALHPAQPAAPKWARTLVRNPHDMTCQVEPKRRATLR
jgi:hypothetical protein